MAWERLYDWQKNSAPHKELYNCCYTNKIRFFSLLITCTHLYVSMVITHVARVRINRVRLPILLVVSWTGKKWIFPCRPRSRLRIWSRETGSAVVPSRLSLLISILRLNLVLTYLRDSPRISHVWSVVKFDSFFFGVGDSALSEVLYSRKKGRERLFAVHGLSERTTVQISSLLLRLFFFLFAV